MFSSFCAAMGVAGWLVMLLLWGCLIVVVIWGITRLFPDPPAPTTPTSPHPRPEDTTAPSHIESGRR